MLGAICGDIIGSIYERKNIKTKEFELFNERDRFTDDSVMTAAISKACSEYTKNRDKELFKENCIKYMQNLGLSHLRAGYGRNFIYWLLNPNPLPYNSYGNGSAMRVSPVAWISTNLSEAEELAKISAEVSHNHPSGIRGAQSVSGSIWILLNGGNKADVKRYIEDNYYNINFTLDSIRDSYKFDVSCQGSVPQAIESFLESNSFEDAIRNAISIGGDSDTIAAIAGSIAEAYYGIPIEIKQQAISYLDSELKECVNNFYNILNEKRYKEGEER